MDHSEYFALIAGFQANRNFSQTFSDSSSVLSVSSIFPTNTPSDFDPDHFIDNASDSNDEFLPEFDLHFVLDFMERQRLMFSYYTSDTLHIVMRNLIARPEFDGLHLRDLKFFCRGAQLDDLDRPFHEVFDMEDETLILTNSMRSALVLGCVVVGSVEGLKSWLGFNVRLLKKFLTPINSKTRRRR